jgi:hypothetical protein
MRMRSLGLGQGPISQMPREPLKNRDILFLLSVISVFSVVF